MDTIKKLLKKEIVRYVIAGGATTVVNIVSFYLLRMFTGLSRSGANVIAISLAILFAFFANKFFVFTESSKKDAVTLSREFISFVGTRLLAMLVEVVGTNLLCDSFRCNEFLSKIIIQFFVVVINYVFGKCFVFKKKKPSIRLFMKKNYIILLAGLLPACFLLGVWIAEKIGPFGGNSLTMVDSLHQYLPFFSDYYDKLQNEGSLFYTWDIGLGSNMLSIIAYYIACPINFLVVLFKQEHIYIAMSLFIGIKIILSGMSFAYYMREKCEEQGKYQAVILIFSTAYALSNYIIGYSWNLMWMDCILILPLIMAGFERMTETGNYKLYVLSLFYGLMCNYYICFMICIFLVMEFLLTNHKSIKKFFTDGFRLAGCSLLAAGMAAFLLIPAYLGLNTTASANRVFPKAEWYGSIWDQIKQLFYLTKPIKNQQFDGGLNIYCGTICFVLLFVYLLNRRIKLWDKVKNVIILVVIFASFNNQLLNYIWHGFHDQYGIPNRFSFLFIFLLLAMCCEVLMKLQKKDILSVMLGIACGYAFLILATKKCTLEKETLLWTEIFITAYAVCMVGFTLTKGMWKRIISYVLLIVCLVETTINGIKGYDSNGYVDISQYFGLESEIRNAIDYLDCKDKPYRVEMMNTKIVDEPTFYNLKSVCLFGSTVSADLVDMMHDLGYYTGANEFLFDGGNTVSNSLLGIKYLLQRDGEYNYFDVNYVNEVDGIRLYENPYALSLGYMVNNDLLDYDGDIGNMFETLNQFVKLSTGVPGVFSELYPEVSTYSDNCEVTRQGDLSEYYSYKRTDSSTCNFQLSFDITDETNDIYIMANCSGINKVRIYIDNEEKNYERLQNQTYHVGHLVKGQKVTVEYCFRDTQANTGTARLIVADMNWESFLQAYDILQSQQLLIGKMEDGYVKGYITISYPGLLFTSIPYDAGWTAYVDGEKYEIDKVGNAFIALKLAAGDHVIEFKYFPPGLKLGLILTFACWLLFGFLCGRRQLQNRNAEKTSGRRKRRTQSAGINETESDATSDLPEPDDRSLSVDEAVEQTEPETLDDYYYKHVDEILKDVFDNDPK